MPQREPRISSSKETAARITELNANSSITVPQ
jgi:hypothetical protein